VNQKVHSTSNFNCLIENEGHVKVTCSHIHRKCCSNLEPVKDYRTLIEVTFTYCKPFQM